MKIVRVPVHLPSAAACGVAAIAFAASVLASTPAHAKQKWLTPFIQTYPQSFRLYGCGICHTNFSGPGAAVVPTATGSFANLGTVSYSGSDSDSDSDSEALNAYGRAFERAGGEGNAPRALMRIEPLDSDGDGTSNVDEILSVPGFFPGYGCDDLGSVVNAPVDLARFVDPAHIGCGILPATTTTSVLTSPSTSNSTTSTTSTTSSTLRPPASSTTTTLFPEVCGSPVSGARGPMATDCLMILSVALDLETCDPPCICAPAGSLPTTATDALVCLRTVTSLEATLDCPCELPSSTTTTTRPASTTTTTADEPSTTTTSTSTTTTSSSSTTTTTLAAGGDRATGRDLYNGRCSGCHRAGSDDPGGFASDLAGDGDLLVPNLGSLDSAMSGITLTEREIADLAAYLDSL